MEDWKDGRVEEWKVGKMGERRNVNRYLQFLNVALASAGESVSGLHACKAARQVPEAAFEEADALAYKIENGLIRLIERLQEKQEAGDWDDTFVVHESNEACAEEMP